MDGGVIKVLKMKKKLVFCANFPSFEDIPNSKECHYILFRAELSIVPEFQSYSFETLATFFDKDDYEIIGKQLAAEWENVLNKFSQLKYYHYYFIINRCPVLFWDRIIKKILAKYQPDLLYIPNIDLSIPIELSMDGDGNSRNKFLDFCLYNLFLSNAVGYKYLKYNESHKDFDFVAGNSMKFVSILINKFTGLSIRFYFKSFFPFYRKKPNEKVLVLAQPPKVLYLLKFLKKKKVNFEFQTYSQFYKNNCINYLAECLKVSSLGESTLGLLDILLKWLDSIWNRDKYLFPILCQKISYKYPLGIISDGEHIPFLRYLSSDNNRHKTKLITIPEGALSFSYYQAYDVMRIPTNNNIIRFFNSFFDKVKFQQKSNLNIPFYICGYSSIMPFSYILGFLLKKYFVHKFGNNLLFIFLDEWFELKDYGLWNINIRDMSIVYGDSYALIEEIQKMNVVLFTNNRSPGFLRFIQSKGLKVFNIDVHWSILASACHLVVSRESSIVVENILLCKPTIIFDTEKTFAGVYEYLYHVKSDCLKVVNNKDELSGVIYSMSSEVKDQYYKYSSFISKPNYEDLVKQIYIKMTI